MAGKKRTVFATYRHQDEVEAAVGDLIIKGFPSETISTLIPEDLGVRTPKPVLVAGEASGEHLKANEILSGTVGLLDRLGAVSIPERGLFIAAGPLMSAWAAVEPAPASGHIAAVLERMGARRPEARRYERVLEERALVSVQCADSGWASRAKKVLRDAGAERLSSSLGTVESLKARHGGVSPI